MVETIAKILPLILFYLFFSSPDDFLYVSITPLGRFIAIAILLFYSILHTYYGILLCFFIIIYYRMNFVEKTSMFDSNMLVGDYYIEPFRQEEELETFRKEHCENTELKFKEKKVHNENACHIFPELEFLNEPCNPCDKNCGITIHEKLVNEENLAYPKDNDNWVFQIWNTWFSENNSKPFANNTFLKTNYTKI